MKPKPIEVTGAQAGLSGKVQMDFALELMLRQGGVATTQQIYQVVEERLGESKILSAQGRAGLRQIVNTHSVKAGYVKPFDKSNPGWFITEEGAKYISEKLGTTVGKIKVTAKATLNLRFALRDIRALLDLYKDQKLVEGKNQHLEVLKRTSIVLLVTGWETFVEDALRSAINSRLEKVASPLEMESAFIAVANAWNARFQVKDGGKAPKPLEYVKWTGTEWKLLIKERAENELRTLNTPKSKNITDICKPYLGIDIAPSWLWPGVTSAEAQKTLDELIVRRGELAHRVNDYLEHGRNLSLQECRKAIEFIENLASCTEAALDEYLNS